MKSLAGVQCAYFYDWYEVQAKALGLKNNLEVELKPHESRLVYISVDDKSPAGMTHGGKQK